MSDKPLKIYTDLDAKVDVAVSGNLNINTTSSFNSTSIVTSSDGMYSVDSALHGLDQELADNVSSIKSSYENMRFKVEDTLDSDGKATVDLTFDAPAGDTYFAAGNIADVAVDLLIDTNNDGRYKNDIASVQLYVQSGSLIAEISAPGAANKPYRLLATNEAAVLETTSLNGGGGGGAGGGSAGGSDISASYVVIGNTASLPNERQLVAGSGISIADNGPGSTIVISSTGGGGGGISSAEVSGAVTSSLVPYATLTGVSASFTTPAQVSGVVAASTHDAVTLGTANGLSLSGQQLSLVAASTASAGVITTGSQTLSGDKTLSGSLTVSGSTFDFTQRNIDSYVGTYIRNFEDWGGPNSYDPNSDLISIHSKDWVWIAAGTTGTMGELWIDSQIKYAGLNPTLWIGDPTGWTIGLGERDFTGFVAIGVSGSKTITIGNTNTGSSVTILGPVTIPNLNLTGSGITGSHDAVTLGTANGLSLSGQQLSLAAASVSSNGAVTTGSQTLSGNKTLSGSLLVTGSEFSIAGTTRSNVQVVNNNLDIIVTGSRAAGTQILIDAKNSSGTSQAVVQAQTYALVQAGTSSDYPYYFVADSTNKFVALEADDNNSTIYLGGTGYASAINVGTAGSRIISIGNTSGSTQVVIKGGTAGTIITGSLTVTGAIEAKDYLKLSAQSVLPNGSLGMIAMSGSNLYFHNGSSWRQISLV